MTTARALVLGLTAFVVFAAVLASGVFQSPEESSAAPTTTTTATTTPNSNTSSTAVAVSMKNLAFVPLVASVDVGGTVTWTNTDSIAHTVTPQSATLWGSEGSGSDPSSWLQPGESWSFTFTKAGEYGYYCIPHAARANDGTYKGMAGTILVGTVANAAPPPALPAANARASVAVNPTAPSLSLPGPDGMVHLDLEANEVTALLADNVSYDFWTFNQTVPGPMLRITEGDTVMLTLANNATSKHPHNIDLHAVTGPGGGAAVTLAAPGESKSFTFKAINPGLFVYHCAAAPIPDHVVNGMYGLILVEPKGGLPPVDREYYVVQSEWYTSTTLGETGNATLDHDKLLAEAPEYYTFNGHVNQLTGNRSLTAMVNESVRIFFGVGSFVPSSFHVIGEVFDRVWMDGNGPATTNRQTVTIPAAGAAIIEFTVDYPGNYTLVDHSLTRSVNRGAIGNLRVDGPANPAIYNGTTQAGSGHG